MGTGHVSARNAAVYVGFTPATLSTVGIPHGAQHPLSCAVHCPGPLHWLQSTPVPPAPPAPAVPPAPPVAVVPTLPLDPDVALPPAPPLVAEVPVVVLVVALEVELVVPPVDASG